MKFFILVLIMSFAVFAQECKKPLESEVQETGLSKSGLNTVLGVNKITQGGGDSPLKVEFSSTTGSSVVYTSAGWKYAPVAQQDKEPFQVATIQQSDQIAVKAKDMYGEEYVKRIVLKGDCSVESVSICRNGSQLCPSVDKFSCINALVARSKIAPMDLGKKGDPGKFPMPVKGADETFDFPMPTKGAEDDSCIDPKLNRTLKLCAKYFPNVSAADQFKYQGNPNIKVISK